MTTLEKIHFTEHQLQKVQNELDDLYFDLFVEDIIAGVEERLWWERFINYCLTGK
jgi:hypothetical protein